jgi:hypothetical protein
MGVRACKDSKVKAAYRRKNGMSEKKRTGISWLLLLLSGILIALGIGRGEQMTVLAKAAKICLECIGIG